MIIKVEKYVIYLSLSENAQIGHKTHKKHLAARLCPDPIGELTVLPQTP